MFDIPAAISNPTAITPKAMEVCGLAHPVNHSRPEHGLEELASLETFPEEVSEHLLLDMQEELGEVTRAKELVREIAGLRRTLRAQHLAIHETAIADRKDSIGVAAKVTAINGEFARFLQGAVLDDRKEERFTFGYARLRREAVDIFR